MVYTGTFDFHSKKNVAYPSIHHYKTFDRREKNRVLKMRKSQRDPRGEPMGEFTPPGDENSDFLFKP